LELLEWIALKILSELRIVMLGNGLFSLFAAFHVVFQERKYGKKPEGSKNRPSCGFGYLFEFVQSFVLVLCKLPCPLRK